MSCCHDLRIFQNEAVVAAASKSSTHDRPMVLRHSLDPPTKAKSITNQPAEDLHPSQPNFRSAVQYLVPMICFTECFVQGSCRVCSINLH